MKPAISSYYMSPRQRSRKIYEVPNSPLNPSGSLITPRNLYTEDPEILCFKGAEYFGICVFIIFLVLITYLLASKTRDDN